MPKTAKELKFLSGFYTIAISQKNEQIVTLPLVNCYILSFITSNKS